jgi:hypothetical protein
MCETIANADVPMEVRPLLFDSKRIPLEKSSQHQLSISRLLKEQEAQEQMHCRTANSSGRSEFDAVSAAAGQAQQPVCERCSYRHATTVSCAPAVYLNEHPDRVPVGLRAAVTERQLQMGREAQLAPHPSMACQSGPDGGPCAACAQAPQRPAHGSANVRPIDVPTVELKMVERAMQFEKKEEIGAGMMPEQVGIAVSGGITMVTASMEAFLRNGAVKRGEQRAVKDLGGRVVGHLGHVSRQGSPPAGHHVRGPTHQHHVHPRRCHRVGGDDGAGRRQQQSPSQCEGGVEAATISARVLG